MNDITASDIFFHEFEPIGGKSLGAIVLMENGWALKIDQENMKKETQAPIDCTFICHLMRPFENAILATMSCKDLPGFEMDYRKTRMPLAQVVDTLNNIRKLEPPTEYSTQHIIREAVANRNAYMPSQIGTQPVRWGNGAYLDTDQIKYMMSKGTYRDPHDHHSPLMFEPFYGRDKIHFQTGTETDGVTTFKYATLLLETGHALYIEETMETVGDDEALFKVTPLAPGKDLILRETGPLDVATLFRGYERDLPPWDINEGVEEYFLNDVINAHLRQPPISSRHGLEQIIAINAANESAEYPVTQFDRVEFDEATGTPKGISIAPFAYDGWSPPARG